MIRGKIVTTANGRPMGSGTQDIIERHVGLDMIDVVGINSNNTWYICKLPEGVHSTVSVTFTGEGPWHMHDDTPDLITDAQMRQYEHKYFPIPAKYVQLLKDNKSAKDVLITLDNE